MTIPATRTALPLAAALACLLAAVLPAAEPVAARTAAAEAARQAWSEETRQAFGFESAAFWRGGTGVTEPRQAGAAALRWDQHTKNSTLECLRLPTDLSAFNTLSFWLHAGPSAKPGTFMIVFASAGGTGTNSYYGHKVTVDWTGWKRLDLRLEAFGRARSPAGWNRIDSLRFTASGWDQTPTDDAVWVLDELSFAFDPTPYRPALKIAKYLQEPAAADFVAKLRPGHPRLILLDEELPRLREFVAGDARGKAWYENVRKTAEDLATKPVQTHRLPDGRRLLSVSRDVCNRLYHWGCLYRMEGDRKWLDRAWQEMAAVAAFKDWNPDHYLDTAEMMHAMAIGYDWFYRDLTEEQRKTVREGLWQHGLRLSYAAYMGLEAEGAQGWRQVANNWNFVCNGGSALAAMAVLDEMPEPAGEILTQSYQLIQIPVRHFEPDGAWWEGLGYWGYSLQYFASYLRGLETAFGSDFGFVQALQNTGFARAGDFPVYLVSPLGGIYNFADSGSGGGRFKHWALFFLADRFHNPLYRHFQEQQTGGGLFDLLYYRPAPGDTALQNVPLDKYFRETEVASMRSSWTDRNALFAGIKCGRNGIAHAHQDLGSFVFYGLGEPWFVDLGTEGQTYLSHQHHLPSWHFYRIREEGHNTLVFDPAERVSQDPKGESTIVRFEASPGDAFAVADLTPAYRQHASAVRRGYRLLDQRRAFLVQDEIQGSHAKDLWWFAHGTAGTTVALAESGREAVLERNGKRCIVSLLAPAEARFTAMDAAPLPTSPNPTIQAVNKGVQKLAVHLSPAPTDVTLAVRFAPTYGFEPAPDLGLAVTPLAAWQLPATEPPGLATLAVGGVPLAGFTPRVFSYTVELPAETAATALPAVTATVAADVAADVALEPAAAFPGTARVTVKDRRSGATALYLVRFLPPALAAAAPAVAPEQAASAPATVGGITVTASHDDGNLPRNVLDADATTRWSASGAEEWIAFDFGAARPLTGIRIAWYSGDARRTRFKVSVSGDGQAWTEAWTGESSGKTAELDEYPFPQAQTARHLRITGYGNSSNLWNSITTVEFQPAP